MTVGISVVLRKKAKRKKVLQVPQRTKAAARKQFITLVFVSKTPFKKAKEGFRIPKRAARY